MMIAHAVTISAGIPGVAQGTGAAGPGAIVSNFYSFALIVGGVLAFAVVVYGGIKYMAAVGNPSGQSDAKEWIEGALLGLLLLVGSYFVLKVINPDLLNLTLPTLDQANITGTAGGSTGSASPDTCGGGCASGQVCQAGSCVTNPGSSPPPNTPPAPLADPCGGCPSGTTCQSIGFPDGTITDSCVADPKNSPPNTPPSPTPKPTPTPTPQPGPTPTPTPGGGPVTPQ